MSLCGTAWPSQPLGSAPPLRKECTTYFRWEHLLFVVVDASCHVISIYVAVAYRFDNALTSREDEGRRLSLAVVPGYRSILNIIIIRITSLHFPLRDNQRPSSS